MLHVLPAKFRDRFLLPKYNSFDVTIAIKGTIDTFSKGMWRYNFKISHKPEQNFNIGWISRIITR